MDVNIDNLDQDPDFEPQKKKQKKSNEIISNELMLYLINNFGRQFYTETDKVQRKMICEKIKKNLIHEKSVVIDSDVIYDNFMNQKRTFLREKKRNPLKVKWPFFEVFQSLGSCIRSESSTPIILESRTRTRMSSIQKESKNNVNDAFVNSSLPESNLNDLFDESFAGSEIAKNENDEKLDVNNIIAGPSTSSNICLQSTPKSGLDNRKARPKGYLFDDAVDIKDKFEFFFGQYTADTKEPPPNENPESIQNEFKNEAEMIAYLDKMIPEESAELFTSQYQATQVFKGCQDNNPDIQTCNADNKTINFEYNDNKEQENMTKVDDKAPILDESMLLKEETINKVVLNTFKNIDDAGNNSQQFMELKELFKENELRIAAMLELEEKIFRMQQDIIKSELKLKAKLIEYMEKNHK